MKKIFINIGIAIGFIFLSLLISYKAYANGCTPLYGGGVTCPKRGEILIDKQVKRPDRDIFVDNLTEFDTKYSPQQQIIFRILVKNTGNDTIDEIQVKDIMPDFVEFVSGPGNFNRNETKNGTLTFYLNNLAPSETREYWVYGKVFESGSLPENLICKLQNRAQARASDNRFSEDIAYFCVEKAAVGNGGEALPKEMPKTGREGLIFALLVLINIFGIGLFLRKKSQNLLKIK